MARKWQTAKVFISSTFRNMHSERDHLVEVVFPELRDDSGNESSSWIEDEQDYHDRFMESLEEQRTRAKRLPRTPHPANIRKVDELPWQRLQAEQWDDLADLLMNWQFLEAKAEARP